MSCVEHSTMVLYVDSSTGTMLQMASGLNLRNLNAVTYIRTL